MNIARLGFALCGSYCTFQKALAAMVTVAGLGYDLYPIFSENAYGRDTRFGNAADWVARAESLCDRPAIHTIEEAEPIGPKALLDVLLIAPCTGNTLAKMAAGITDSSVTMAAKAHLRNDRPLVIAVSTNDGLSANWQNIGKLLSRKQVYFVPFRQDDPQGKPNSIVADFSKIPDTLEAALAGRQIQPLLLG